MVVYISPALRLETFFETGFGLARDGKFNSKTQLPRFLQMVVLAHEFRDEIAAPRVAGTAIRGLAAALAPFARARGYRPRYPQYSDPESP